MGAVSRWRSTFCRHGIALAVSDGGAELLPFAVSVADLHRDLVAMLDRHDLPATYPEPPGFRDQPAAKWDSDLGEFVLSYAEVRATLDPEQALTEFLTATYRAAANLAKWDRAALEREPIAL